MLGQIYPAQAVITGYMPIRARAAADAVVRRMSTPPDGARTLLIQSVIAQLVAAGVWDKLDLLYVMAAHDSQAALINWRNPGSHMLTLSNSPAFVADRGFTGDGLTSRIDTGYTPSVHAVRYAQDSCHMGLWAYGTTSDNAYDCGNGAARINARNGTVVQVYAQESSQNTSAGASGGTARGHTLWSRTSSTEYTTYRDGAALVSFSGRASGGLGISPFLLCGNTSGYSALPESAFHAGAALSPDQVAAIYQALRVYMQSVGAA